MIEDEQQKMEEAYKEGIKFANDLVNQFNFLKDPTSFTNEPPPEIHPDILCGYMEGIKFMQDMFDAYPFLCSEMTMAEQALSEQYHRFEQLKNNRTNLSSSSPKDHLPTEATVEAPPIITCEPNLTTTIQNAAINAGIGAVKNVGGGITGVATGAGAAVIASVLDDLDQVRDCKKQYDKQTATVDRAINKTINKAIGAAVTGIDPINMLQTATKKAVVHLTSSSVSTLTATIFEKQDEKVDCKLNKSLIFSNMIGGATGGAIGSSLLSAVTANPVTVSTATLFGAIGGTVQGYVEAKKEQNSCIIKKEEEKNATTKSTTSPRP